MRRSLFGLALLAGAVCLSSVPTAGQDKQEKKEEKKAEKKKATKPEAFVQAKDAGPDFAAQGEYEGVPSKEKCGIQIIAKGDGSFVGRMISGGLPGDGWDGKEVSKIKGRTVDGRVHLTMEGKQGKDFDFGVIENGKYSTPKEAGNLTSEFKKVERKSPTEGAKPPEGAIVLFGAPEDIKNWAGGKIKELPDGKFLDVGCKTKQAFQDYTLHVEFRLPFIPKGTGQGRGNSGVYMQDRYEVQVLDSFGLEGKNNECGGIYTVAAPNMNMCFPPLAWQTYDIDFTAAKYEDGKKSKNAIITVKHNGVIIHENLEIPKPTGGGKDESPEPGAIQLQNHGDPVVFRNIWIVEKK